jgi:Leucine rich repeat/Leucine Rich repeat
MPSFSRPLLPRRWFRFGIRALMVAVLVIAVGLGWIVGNARIQRDAVAAIRRAGGTVDYDWEWKNGESLRDAKPFAPKWLVDSVGPDIFGHVVWVSVGQSASPLDLKQVGQLSRLEGLVVRGPFVNDAGLSNLRGLTKLACLDIGDTGEDCLGPVKFPNATPDITDAGLAHLRSLVRLSSLNVSGSRVTDSGLAALEGLTGLTALNLAGTQITDAGLLHLTVLTKLGYLRLDDLAITDAGLAALKRLENLSYLSLRRTRITDAGLACLSGLTKLRILELNGTAVSDAAVEELKMRLGRVAISR